MDIGKAYTFIKDEDNWIVKLIIAGLCSMFSWLILPYFLLVGYQVGVMRNVMDGEEHPLPEWTDIGAMFMDGLYIGVASIVYALPIILMVCIGLVVTFAAGGDPDVSIAIPIAWSLLGCLMLIFGIVLAFIVPALFIQFSRTNDFGSLFRFSDVIAIARTNLVDILLTILAAWAAQFVLSMAFSLLIWTVCIPIVIMFAGNAWVSISTAHLYGQIADNEDGKLDDAKFAAA